MLSRKSIIFLLLICSGLALLGILIYSIQNYNHINATHETSYQWSIPSGIKFYLGGPSHLFVYDDPPRVLEKNVIEDIAHQSSILIYNYINPLAEILTFPPDCRICFLSQGQLAVFPSNEEGFLVNIKDLSRSGRFIPPSTLSIGSTSRDNSFAVKETSDDVWIHDGEKEIMIPFDQHHLTVKSMEFIPGGMLLSGFKAAPIDNKKNLRNEDDFLSIQVWTVGSDYKKTFEYDNPQLHKTYAAHKYCTYAGGNLIGFMKVPSVWGVADIRTEKELFTLGEEISTTETKKRWVSGFDLIQIVRDPYFIDGDYVAETSCLLWVQYLGNVSNPYILNVSDTRDGRTIQSLRPGISWGKPFLSKLHGTWVVGRALVRRNRISVELYRVKDLQKLPGEYDLPLENEDNTYSLFSRNGKLYYGGCNNTLHVVDLEQVYSAKELNTK